MAMGCHKRFRFSKPIYKNMPLRFELKRICSGVLWKALLWDIIMNKDTTVLPIAFGDPEFKMKPRRNNALFVQSPRCPTPLHMVGLTYRRQPVVRTHHSIPRNQNAIPPAIPLEKDFDRIFPPQVARVNLVQ